MTLELVNYKFFRQVLNIKLLLIIIVIFQIVHLSNIRRLRKLEGLQKDYTQFKFLKPRLNLKKMNLILNHMLHLNAQYQNRIVTNVRYLLSGFGRMDPLKLLFHILKRLVIDQDGTHQCGDNQSI